MHGAPPTHDAPPTQHAPLWQQQGSPPPWQQQGSPPPWQQHGSPPSWQQHGSPPLWQQQGSPWQQQSHVCEEQAPPRQNGWSLGTSNRRRPEHVPSLQQQLVTKLARIDAQSQAMDAERGVQAAGERAAIEAQLSFFG